MESVRPSSHTQSIGTSTNVYIWHRVLIISLSPPIYLWSKGRLVCFVLSCWDLPNHSASCHALGIFGKLSMNALTWFETVWSFMPCSWYLRKALDECTDLVSDFGAMVWKLLIIEQFSQWKLNKIETENCIGIWGCCRCCWEALDESN
jgi:hypothetical protein